MKKLIFIVLAAIAFSCGDGSNRSSERESDDMNNNDLNNRELVEPDTTGMTDTTSMDMNDNTDGDLLEPDTVQ